MPFKSEAQRRKFYSDPKLRKYASEFESATHGKLPERVGGKNEKLHKAALSAMKNRRK